MSNMITRCPKCATSFRITSAQLQSAKGAVRCGSCLHIFKAQDHLISSDTPAATATKPRASAAAKPAAAPAKPTAATTAPSKPASAAPQKTVSASPVKAPVKAPEKALTGKSPISTTAAASPQAKPAATPSKASNTPAPSSSKPASATSDTLLFSQSDIDQEIANLGDDDDILISDDMDQPSKKPDSKYLDGFLDIDPAPKQSASLFERNERIEERNEDDDIDESWAMSLLDESDEENKLAASKAQTAVKKEKKEESRAHQHSSDEYLDVADDDSSGDYDAKQDAHDNSTRKQHSHLFSLVSDAPEPNNFREMFTEEEHSDEMQASRSGSDRTETAPMRAYDTSRAALLMNIMPEPVIMTSRRKRSWYQRKMWLLLSLLMILILVAQVAWLQFNHLSRIQPYRAAYEFICPVLGCQLPVLIDREMIRVRNLVVRKHPTTENALIVDVILINTAPFKQPFPELVMAFSDIDERPVAARRFRPREYLAGELAGLNLMPQGQPVYISLELVDPGEQAVNYKIEPY